eukprot:gene18397-22018_t
MLNRSIATCLQRTFIKSSNVGKMLATSSSQSFCSASSSGPMSTGGSAGTSSQKINPNLASTHAHQSQETPVSKLYKGEVLLEGIKHDGTTLKWYKHVGYTYDPVKGGFLPLIDNRAMKTPVGNHFVVPRKEIAMAIAAEWWTMGKYVMPTRLPLTTTAATCIDLTPISRQKAIDELIGHLATDPVCNRDTDDSPLKRLQNEKKHLESMNNWQLLGLQLITTSSKSFLITLNLYYQRIRLDHLYQTIALEEEYQSDIWGKIPFGHDLAEMETANEIAAPLFLLRSIDPIPLPVRPKAK